MNRPKIAYLMSRFPHLPETFILREMIELERQGWDITLFPLVIQTQAVVHEEALAWLEHAHSAALFSTRVMTANLRSLFCHPVTTFRVLARVILENLSSPKFLSRALVVYPKAVWMAWVMQRQGITHIHAHYATHPALAAWIIHQLTGISYTVTVHAHDIFVNRSMLATKLRDAGQVVAISTFNREFLCHTLGEWLRPKIKVIHCGIDPVHYPKRTSTGQNTRFHIINVGSLQAYKGQAYLIQASALLKAQGIPVQCTIVGEGEERPVLESLVELLKLGESVTLTGAKTQSEVAGLLQAAQCYVQPSIIAKDGKMEGIPVALMEALASGLPVVATAISGVPELVRPGETGLTVPPVDPAALAEALAEVYHQPEAAASRAERGRLLVCQEFNIHQSGKDLSALFSGLIPVPAISG